MKEAEGEMENMEEEMRVRRKYGRGRRPKWIKYRAGTRNMVTRRELKSSERSGNKV